MSALVVLDRGSASVVTRPFRLELEEACVDVCDEALLADLPRAVRAHDRVLLDDESLTERDEPVLGQHTVGLQVKRIGAFSASRTRASYDVPHEPQRRHDEARRKIPAREVAS